MGEIDAHHNLSLLYEKGEGVEKDVKKYIYLPEEAAMGGHPEAKYNLGCYEWKNERIDRAVNHLIIAANLGFDKSIQRLTCVTSKDTLARKSSPWLFVHTRLLLMQRKVHKGRK